MNDVNLGVMPRGCRVIDFPQFMDARGGLSFAESQGHIPFAVERVFWLYNLIHIILSVNEMRVG